MENKFIRKSISNFCKEHDTNMYLIDYFDKSIIGISADYRLVYDLELMIQELMEDDDISYEDAYDYICYNTLRSLPYLSGGKDGANPPVVIEYKTSELCECYGIDDEEEENEGN